MANILNNSLADACRNGYYNLAINLVVQGANDFNWALANACLGGHKELVLFMREPASNWTLALQNACLGGHNDIVLLLDPHGPDEWNSGLYYACEGGQKETALLMIKYGANINRCSLELTESDILYLIQKEVKEMGKYQKRGNYLIKRTTQTRKLLTYILIDDLVGIIMSY